MPLKRWLNFKTEVETTLETFSIFVVLCIKHSMWRHVILRDFFNRSAYGTGVIFVEERSLTSDGFSAQLIVSRESGVVEIWRVSYSAFVIVCLLCSSP